jgi:hypothetical protein
MAEGHVWFDEPFVYVYHTIRWDDDTDAFASNGRNAEDLGVDVFSPSSSFNLSMPIITENWKLDLAAGESAPCAYDWVNYRYCVPLKVVIGASGTSEKVRPSISFTVRGSTASCPRASPREDGGATAGASVSVAVHAFSYKDGVGAATLVDLPVMRVACVGGVFEGTTATTTVFGGSVWIVAVPRNTGVSVLSGLTAAANYESGGVSTEL